MERLLRTKVKKFLLFAIMAIHLLAREASGCTLEPTLFVDELRALHDGYKVAVLAHFQNEEPFGVVVTDNFGNDMIPLGVYKTLETIVVDSVCGTESKPIYLRAGNKTDTRVRTY